MYYNLLTLGCQMNVADSERIHSVLKKMGYTPVKNEEDADILGIVACSVRQKAIDKVYSRIYKWNKWKDNKNLFTFLTGCVLPADKDKFRNLFDFIFPTSEAELLPELIRQYGVPNRYQLEKSQGIPKNKNIFSLWNLTPSYQSDIEAYIPIQNGCDKFCSFCAVPYTRGREVSRPSEDILKELCSTIRAGFKTVTLLGQNVNSYGNDRDDEISFPQLLREADNIVSELGRDVWIYFTSPHPRDMSEEVIDVIAGSRNIARQIHLPMQSGDNKILIRMNRNHSMNRYREIVRMIRKKIPDATLFTDIIVGFPGESHNQFLKTAAAMEEFKFNMAYIAIYSPRPGAASSRWEDNVTQIEKKYRLHYLTELLKKSSRIYNDKLFGKKIKVLVTGKHRKEGYLAAITEGRINVIFPSDDESLIGTFRTVKIRSAEDFSLSATLLQNAEIKAI